MNREKLTGGMQVVGNLGIILGLVFVGIQLYQDRQLKLAELSASYFDGRILANAAAMGDSAYRSIVKAAYAPESMTPEDAYVFFLNLDNWRSLDMRSSRLEQLGLYTDAWQSTSGLILEAKTAMGIRDMKQWLGSGNKLLPPHYAEKLREELEEPGKENEFKEKLETLLGNTTPLR